MNDYRRDPHSASVTPAGGAASPLPAARPLATRHMPTLWLVALLVAALATLAGCPLEDDDEPGIVSMFIDPDTINLSEVGMTDEFFTIDLVVRNFEDIEAVRVFIQNLDRDAIPAEITIEGDTIVLTGIAKTWFGDQGVGTYNLGAEVRSPTATVLERNLATVTITP